MGTGEQQHADCQPACGVDRGDTGQEEWRAGIGDEADALVEGGPGLEGARHVAQEVTHDENADHRCQIQQPAQLQGTCDLQANALFVYQTPAYPMGDDEQANCRQQAEKQQVG